MAALGRTISVPSIAAPRIVFVELIVVAAVMCLLTYRFMLTKPTRLDSVALVGALTALLYSFASGGLREVDAVGDLVVRDSICRQIYSHSFAKAPRWPGQAFGLKGRQLRSRRRRETFNNLAEGQHTRRGTEASGHDSFRSDHICSEHCGLRTGDASRKLESIYS